MTEHKPISCSNQINDEYNRVLDHYRFALEEAVRHIDFELGNLEVARTQGYRFYIRHALLELADTIATTDTKLSVFGNLVWEPGKRESNQ